MPGTDLARGARLVALPPGTLLPLLLVVMTMAGLVIATAAIIVAALPPHAITVLHVIEAAPALHRGGRRRGRATTLPEVQANHARIDGNGVLHCQTVRRLCRESSVDEYIRRGIDRLSEPPGDSPNAEGSWPSSTRVFFAHGKKTAAPTMASFPPGTIPCTIKGENPEQSGHLELDGHDDELRLGGAVLCQQRTCLPSEPSSSPADSCP